MDKSQQERVAEIAERVSKATKGPWEIVRGHESDDCGITESGQGGSSIAQMVWDHDAPFIAASREDVPYLLALVQAQERQIELENKRGNQNMDAALIWQQCAMEAEAKTLVNSVQLQAQEERITRLTEERDEWKDTTVERQKYADHWAGVAAGLLSAAKAVGDQTCGCNCSSDQSWHSERCPQNIMRAAIAEVEK